MNRNGMSGAARGGAEHLARIHGTEEDKVRFEVTRVTAREGGRMGGGWVFVGLRRCDGTQPTHWTS